MQCSASRTSLCVSPVCSPVVLGRQNLHTGRTWQSSALNEAKQHLLCSKDGAGREPRVLARQAGADWEGMAPAAKLAFQDLGLGASGSIDLAGDLAADYYPYSYARCAAARRIPCLRNVPPTRLR